MPELTPERLERFVSAPHLSDPWEVAAMARELITARARITELEAEARECKRLSVEAHYQFEDVLFERDQAAERVAELEDPDHWVAGRDTDGNIRLCGGHGLLVAHASDTRSEIQGWFDRCDHSRYRRQYLAALELLDAEEASRG
ncbi:hypothetical protein [Nocardia sp. CC227C]|uniref:hypothetical protein n=1 Tax=Nocardia sp. CC227C TaxID=3044562 RepID=UPI00278BE5E3|nr:hypothetical protein [Nocardia sp. CC227C]